ncbi:MAG: hypothetical protein OER95_03635 [Acidimicrobiia bacterium]|nr:hypothetical protein [Acidimicrobiia bacterium]
MITQGKRTKPSQVRVDHGAVSGLSAPRLGLLAAVVAVLAGLYAGLSAPADAVDGHGTAAALPLLYWIAVAVAALATVVLLWTAAQGASSSDAAVPFVWLLLLHTAPQLVAENAGGTAAWNNVGLVRLVGETRGADAVVDGRLAWPGFFAALAAPLGDLGPEYVDLLLRLWPSAVTGAIAVLVAGLGRRAYPTHPMVGSLSALVYVLAAWTGHDHFSPDSLGLLLFVSLIALMESGPLRSRSAWSASVPLLSRFAVSGGDRPASQATTVFVTLVVLGLAAVAADPVSTSFLLLALLMLGLYGRAVAWRLLVLLGAVTVLWALVVADPVWSADGVGLSGIFADGLDKLGPATDQSGTPSPAHLLVDRVRLGLVAAALAMTALVAVAMAGERRRHLRPATPLVPLTIVCLIGLAPTGVGMASITEVYAFALPFISVILGRLLAGVGARNLPIAGAVLALALSPALVLARFGDDSFQRSTDADRAAVEAGYAAADGDTLFVADNRHLPWRDQALAGNTFALVPASADDAWLTQMRSQASAAGKGRIVVYLTASQQAWRVHGLGDSTSDLDEVAAWLRNQPGTELLYGEGSSWAIEVQP